MKRFFCLFLSVFLLVGLFAGCGEEKPQEEAPTTLSAFSVGYAKADISTDKPVQLYGYAAGGERLSESILDPQLCSPIELHASVIFINLPPSVES